MKHQPGNPPQDTATVRHLRLGIGSVGLALPVALVVGHMVASRRVVVLDSLSAYYHTEMRNIFVGALCAIGVFLIAYRYRWPDDLLGTIAGTLAILVALFPVHGPTGGDSRLVGLVHQAAAGSLFVLLAAFCLFLFTRPDRAGVPPRRAANRCYRACGLLILAAIAGALASGALPTDVRHALQPLLWCETLAVAAFGTAWVVKSDAIFRMAGLPDAPPSAETIGPTSATAAS
ncbi:DUF998 domain-containing protein [Micromonospora sp. NPDC049580]|uniref:DUF998 domain-containing protein n=1 Tax=unclassified Micromonospora TaxID=2617518 RepID=UPI0033A35FF9